MNYSVYQEFFIVVAICLTYLYGKIKTKNGKREKLFNALCIVAFATYVIMLLYISLFSRESGVHNEVVVRPFISYKTILTVYACLDVYKQILDNVLVFIPFGLIFPQILKLEKNKNYILITVICGICLSGGIELHQHILARGVCDFDDVLNNAFGAAIGCGVFSFVKFAEIKDETLVLKKNWLISFMPMIAFAIISFIISFYRENVLLGMISG